MSKHPATCDYTIIGWLKWSCVGAFSVITNLRMELFGALSAGLGRWSRCSSRACWPGSMSTCSATSPRGRGPWPGRRWRPWSGWPRGSSSPGNQVNLTQPTFIWKILYVPLLLDPEWIPEAEMSIPHHAEAGAAMAKTSHVLVYQDKEADRILMKYNMKHIKTLPLSWLVKCLRQYTLLDPEAPNPN